MTVCSFCGRDVPDNQACNCRKGDRFYQVGFWYTVYGSTRVRADKGEEAEQKVKEILSYSGLDEIEYETNDRDYGAQDAGESE